MGITLAGGAQFPSFDGLIGLGRLIITIGLIAQLGIGIGRLFRGAAPEFIPAIVKAALAFFAISSLNHIGAAAHQTGGLLAEAIAGADRMDGFLSSIESTLLATYNPDSGYFDLMTLEFWFGLASVACMGFAFVSKFIVLEVLWPLYLGLVVISGTFSISLSTLPGMRTAQSWILTLMEAVSWPMIFQILLGIVAVVCEQQVSVMERADDNFIPLLKGLATLCAVSFLTVMVPIIAARLMRGEGASAAMSFVAAKASSLVTGMTARAAVTAAAVPAKAAAGPVRAGLGGGASMAAGAATGAVAGAANKIADAAPGAALAASLLRRPRPGRAGRTPMQAQGGQPGNSPRSIAKTPAERVVQSAPDAQAPDAPNVSPMGQDLPQGRAPSSTPAQTSPAVSPAQPAAEAVARGDKLKFNAPPTDAKSMKGTAPKAPPAAPKAWSVSPPPPPLPHIDSLPTSSAERAARRAGPGAASQPQGPDGGRNAKDSSNPPPRASEPMAQPPQAPPFEGQHRSTASPPPGAFSASRSAASSQQSGGRTQGSAQMDTANASGSARPAVAGPGHRAAAPSSTTRPSAGPESHRSGRAPATPAHEQRRPAPATSQQQQAQSSERPRPTYRNIKGSTRYSNQAYTQLKQTHPAAAERIKAAWKADPPPPKGPGQEPARKARRERIDALTRQIVDETKGPKK